jgi:hypothetical protein
MGINHDILVTARGGSKTDANFAFATADSANGVRGQFSADETGATGAALVTTIQGSARMVYRLSLADAAIGTEGTFNLSGFTTHVFVCGEAVSSFDILERIVGTGLGREVRGQPSERLRSPTAETAVGDYGSVKKLP